MFPFWAQVSTIVVCQLPSTFEREKLSYTIERKKERNKETKKQTNKQRKKERQRERKLLIFNLKERSITTTLKANHYKA